MLREPRRTLNAWEFSYFQKRKPRRGRLVGASSSFTARCAVAGTDLSTWMVRQGWAKPNDPPEPALADAAEAAKSEHIGLWRRGEFDKPLITRGAAAVRTTSLERSEITPRGSRSR